MARKRRPINDPLVTVEVPQSVALALRALTAEDILKLKTNRHWLHRAFKLLSWGSTLITLVVMLYVFGTSQGIYDSALSGCKEAMASTVSDEEELNRICSDLTASLKPASNPLERLGQVWQTAARPAEDLLGTIFIKDYQLKYTGGQDEVGVQTTIARTSTVDYSGELDSLGNPSLKAVVQEAIRLQSEFSTPWRYVVDACFYESGGLKQYTSPGVLTQGKNMRDGVLSSTDWGLCQINDLYHPDKMELAKGSWQGNLRASFMVFEPRWKAVQGETGEYQLRLLWSKYNGSGPYDLYADRVVKVHATLEPRIAEVMKELESQPVKTVVVASTPSISASSGEGVSLSLNLRTDVPVYDGESANIRLWAINNQTWTIPANGEWHFCAQTDQSGWDSYDFAAGISAGGICANATLIDKAVSLFGSGLTVHPFLDHSGSHPWFTVAINCPGLDYVLTNTTSKDIVFEHAIDGDTLTLYIHYK